MQVLRQAWDDAYGQNPEHPGKAKVYNEDTEEYEWIDFPIMFEPFYKEPEDV